MGRSPLNKSKIKGWIIKVEEEIYGIETLIKNEDLEDANIIKKQNNSKKEILIKRNSGLNIRLKGELNE